SPIPLEAPVIQTTFPVNFDAAKAFTLLTTIYRRKLVSVTHNWPLSYFVSGGSCRGPWVQSGRPKGEIQKQIKQDSRSHLDHISVVSRQLHCPGPNKYNSDNSRHCRIGKLSAAWCRSHCHERGRRKKNCHNDRRQRAISVKSPGHRSLHD